MIEVFGSQRIFSHKPVARSRVTVARGSMALPATVIAGVTALGFVVQGGSHSAQAHLQAELTAPTAAILWDEPVYPTAPADARLVKVVFEGAVAEREARTWKAIDRSSLPLAARAALGNPAAKLAPTKGDPAEELSCLALNIYFEAQREPYLGRLAVSHVVLNRVADKRFPDTVCKVIRQGGERVRDRCQFSWWCDGRSDRPKNNRFWAVSQAIAEEVFWGETQDPTEGALWYHADYVKPYWRRAFKKGPTIGRHIFYLGRDKGAQIASQQ